LIENKKGEITMKTKMGGNKNKKRLKRNVCLWMLTTLLVSQVFQPLAWAADAPLELTAQGPQTLMPVIALGDPKSEAREQSVPGVVDPQKPLSRTLNTEAKILESKNKVRNLEEYGFEDALDHLRPDLASAVIVKSLRSRDLRRLTELGFEVGIAVLRGKIVLFTSGNADEIHMLPAAQGLLEKARLMAHVHPKGQRGKPSPTDIQEADKRVEYVVGEEGVYVYNHKGLKSEYPRNYGWFSRKIAALQNKAASSKKARDLLNAFIKSMDDYNEGKEASVPLLSGDPVTVFPGQPSLTTAATGGYITVDQYSSSYFRMNYSTGGISGNSVQAGIDFGANSGPQNLNGLSKITFELKFRADCVSPSNLPCVGVRFVDADNRVSTIYLRDTLRTVFTQTDITRTQILAANPSFDLTRVKQINFFISAGNMAVSGGADFLEVKTGGLVYSPFSPEGYPVVSAQVFDQTKITELPQYPILSAQAQNGAEITQGQSSSQYYYFNYRVTDADDRATSRIDFPSPQNLGSAVTLALSGPTGRQLKVQVIDAAGKVANYYLNPQRFTQNFTIPLTGAGLPRGFDPSKIVRIQFVMDKAHAGSFYNNSETVYIQTKSLAFVVNGLPYSQTSITNLPGEPVVRSSATNGGTITQNQTSSRNFSFVYNVAAAGATAMSEISWGQFVNGVFQGISGPCGNDTGKIILAVNGPAGKRIKVQLVDANNKTADYLLNLTGTLQSYYLLMSALPAGFDINKVAAIRFIPESAQTGATGTIAVETSGLSI
jgi:hypothetical protein